MNKTKQNSKKKKLNFLEKEFLIIKKKLIPIILGLVLLILSFFAYQVTVSDKFYPFTFIGDTNITFLNYEDAQRLVENKFNSRALQKVEFIHNQQNFIIDLATSSAQLNLSKVEDYFEKTRTGNFFQTLLIQFSNLFSPARIYPQINLSLDSQLEPVSKLIEKQPQNAQIIFDEVTIEGSSSARIQIKESLDGSGLDNEQLEKNIKDYLLTGQYSNSLPIKVTAPKVSTNHVSKAKEALENIQRQPLKLTFEDNFWTIDVKQLLTLLDLTSGETLLDKEKTKSYIKKLSLEIDRDIREGLFKFNPNTRRVTAFKPSQEGKKLDQDKTYQLITAALITQSINSQNPIVELPVNITEPKIKTSDVNDLGIKELLGRGISNFAGSIPNRIYNVSLTASKINGVLIPPGEVFSFNQTVGDISAATGFKQAYVIKEGRTILDDGGGVCQDSTTLFRAVLNAGLPVVKRTAHAYRVSYYEQGFPPGLDATVFYPSVDFQFRNDTPAHILIQAYTLGTTLYVDLYGTSDNRIVDISTPVVTNKVPAPPELRQDDPTLPRGTIKQVDWAAQGATVTFTRKVTRNSEVIHKETWKSVYKPWQAVFLVGTQ